MTTLRLFFYCIASLAVAGCAEDPPPVSADEFMEDSRLLEATMVRCNQDRARLKYTAECLNAREAINRLEVREQRARDAELEAQSIRKRQALRQTQEAAAEARRRALEEQRLREEAELLGHYATVVPSDAPMTGDVPPVNQEVPPATGDLPPLQVDPAQDDATDIAAEQVSEDNMDEVSELSAIREELERRQREPR